MPETHDQKTYAVFEHPRNKKLVEKLEKSGGSVILMTPAELIENEIPPLEELNSFDWLIFADVCAVEFFLEYLRRNDFDLFELDDRHICALGESVADRLRYAQIHTDVIPTINAAEKIVEALTDYIFEKSDLAGKRFLLLKEAEDEFEFAGALENIRAEVRAAAVYRARFEPTSAVGKIKALIKGGAADEIIFTAPEDFLHFRFLFRGENIARILGGSKISAIDEMTRQMLAENQLTAKLLAPLI